ncbi:MAG: hypothetical protein K8J31_05835 [Anaerolineae bacterium]|nr:hypothetical protein [Anaerolineae bacterium]
MSFIVGKDGDISLFRVGTLVAIVGIVLVVGGVAAYFLDQNSYRVPLDVEPYPGAESWGNIREAGATRRLVFLTSATPEEVAAYYDEKLRALDGAEQGCERIPASGEVAAAATDRTVVPYWYKCLFQRTGLRSSQLTTVTVQPGVFSADPDLNTEGKTVIEHSQRWQP